MEKKLSTSPSSVSCLHPFFPDLALYKQTPHCIGMGEGGITWNTNSNDILLLPGVVQPGLKVDQVTSHLDIYPTLAALAEAETAILQLDGYSLLNLLSRYLGFYYL